MIFGEEDNERHESFRDCFAKKTHYMEDKEKEALAQEFMEWYKNHPDKLRLTVEAIHWAREKGLIAESAGFGGEVQRRALIMLFLEQKKATKQNI